MTITELARFSMRRQQYEERSTTAPLPNGSTPPPGHVNPFGDPNRNITGRTDWQKIVPVSDAVAEEMKAIALDRAIHNRGMSGTKYEVPNVINAYLSTISSETRSSAAWTLEQIHRTEANRLAAIIQTHNPGWQPGQSFDTSILEGERNAKAGFDVRA